MKNGLRTRKRKKNKCEHQNEIWFYLEKIGKIAKVDLKATWKTGCIPSLTNLTITWFKPNKIENIIKKDAAKKPTGLFFILFII